MEASAPKTLAPPYFAFRTLLNTIERMEEPGPPVRIDRTFLDNMSGAAQTQFIHGLRSLGLIEEDGTVKQELIDLVKARGDDRRALLRSVIEARYPEAVELGKSNATNGQLLEVFRDYGAQGDTARKAIAFYLAACEYAGEIPVSPNFKTPSVPRSDGAAKRNRRPKGGKDETPEEPDDRQPVLSGAGKHPAIQTLVQNLPSFGEPGDKPDFPAAARKAWFDYAKATFNLIYAYPDGDEPAEAEEARYE